jgi:tetratricopeptide (TPR) repeat protein
MRQRPEALEPSAAASWRLRILSPEAAAWEHLLDEARVVVGRAEDCDIVLDDERVSKRHFEIHRKGAEIVLIDLGSRNGTRVNGRTLSDVVLRPGDRIELGRSRLEVLAAGPTASAPSPPPKQGSPELEPTPPARRPERPQLDSPPAAPAEGPRRVEVLSKSAVPAAARAEARHASGRWKMPLYGAVIGLLLLLVISLAGSKRDLDVENNPLSRVHVQEAPGQDLFQRTRQQEAEQLRQTILAEVRGMLEPLDEAALGKMSDHAALEKARARLRSAEGRLAALPPAETMPDAEAEPLRQALASSLQALERRVSELHAQHAGRIEAGLRQARDLLAAGRAEAAVERLREVLRQDPRNAQAQKMISEMQSRQAQAAEAQRRQLLLRKFADEVEQFYRSGVTASDLGNAPRALSDWAQAEEALRKLKGVPGANGSEELREAEAHVADIQTRKARSRPENQDEGEKEAQKLLGKARLYEDLGQRDKAEELYRQVLQLVPNPEHRFHKQAQQKLAPRP